MTSSNLKSRALDVGDRFQSDFAIDSRRGRGIRGHCCATLYYASRRILHPRFQSNHFTTASALAASAPPSACHRIFRYVNSQEPYVWPEKDPGSSYCVFLFADPSNVTSVTWLLILRSLSLSLRLVFILILPSRAKTKKGKISQCRARRDHRVGKELKSNLVMVTILSKREHEEKENESHRVWYKLGIRLFSPPL